MVHYRIIVYRNKYLCIIILRQKSAHPVRQRAVLQVHGFEHLFQVCGDSKVGEIDAH